MLILQRSLILALISGAFLGVLGVAMMAKIDQWTSTEEFCGSRCHSMKAYVANEPVYVNSSHRTTYTGIVAGCGDCHIPPTLAAATWTHITAGIRDVYATLFYDFSTRQAWNRRRAEMAYRVRDWLLANDSVTCRSCHRPQAIRPRRESGKRLHELAQRQKITCIGCHFNLVHEPVRPRVSFLRRVQVRPASNGP